MSRAAIPASGWWWVRLSSATPRGADLQWKVYRVLDGAIQPPGSVVWYSPSAKWLRGAEWVPAELPPACGSLPTAITTSGTPTWSTPPAVDHEKVRRVAAEIVDAFVGLSDQMAAYYKRHPDHRDDIVAVVDRLIVKATRAGTGPA
ncbi:MAG: hypothetical protein K2V38_18280 [Gemmataceae bacterium]|nr:hypothetical protein [Gemmataceae bacterium]